MTAARSDGAERDRPSVLRIVVLVVAALLFAYVTAQAVGNFVGVQRLVTGYNDLVRGTGVEPRAVPWTVLVVDVAIAPAGWVVAWLVSRRMTALQSVVVFLTALCAVSALWFTLSQLVLPSVTIGS